MKDRPYQEAQEYMVPRKDYETVSKELEKATIRIKQLENRNFIKEGVMSFFSNLPKITLILGIVAGLGYGTYWSLFKGTASGNASRENAAVSARAFVSTVYGDVTRVYCTESGSGTPRDYMLCVVQYTMPNGTQGNKEVYCDDDYAPYNDGCIIETH